MEKTYNPHSIEQRWYQTWEDNNYFHSDSHNNPSSDSYCIMIPPPNVTGYLHMGHAFQDTIMDILIRYQRMQGKRTLWQAGTDHAGIATQMVVERQLENDTPKRSRHDLGRDAFIEKIWDWKQHSGNTITQQLRRMGASLDWSKERFTMDKGLSKAVQEVFIQLYKEGLIYRGKRLVNWDPKLHTAVSDLEVIASEEQGHLWHLRYPLSDDPQKYLIVATTRPETMLGDAAVAVHPEDTRYQDVIGKTVQLPLCQREIPIIADEYVDPEFGTGCVKITPAHDFNDYQVGKRHHLPQHNIFTIDACINDQAPEKYQGMDRFVARKQIVADFKAEGLLEKIEPHKLTVPRGDRSGVIIEPFLTNQWYVKVEALAKPAIEAVEKGDIRFIPDNWKNTYYEWMHNIEDWCISRQIWWGHRIPAWYDQQGNIYVGKDEASIRQTHHLSSDILLHQDEDVLDTWFSSALWPFSTLGWPDKTPQLADFYPTNVLVTGFDIIFFWVARMIMMGLKFTGQVPFHEVYIHGLVRDSHGQKMSKSKGNVLDPIDLIDGINLETLVQKRTSGMMQPHLAEKIAKITRKDFPQGIPSFGCDALRFTFASQATTGRDIKFDMKRIEGYRNFCNKLWNAARYVLMNTENQDCATHDSDNISLSLADKWIYSRFQEITEQVHQALQQYRLDLAAQAIYEFTWNEYCDWYLELSKAQLHQAEQYNLEAIQRGTRQTLVRILESLLRLAHPIIPFITEEIWQRIAPLAGQNSDTIMLQSYPQKQTAKIDHDALQTMQWVQAVILGVRQIRSGMDIKPGKMLTIYLQDGQKQDFSYLQAHRHYLQKLANIDTIHWLDEQAENIPEAATALVGKMKILIPIADLIDKTAELQRLGKAIKKVQDDIQRTQNKLGNEKFTARAPEAVVNKEKQKLHTAQETLKSLHEQKIKIEKL